MAGTYVSGNTMRSARAASARQTGRHPVSILIRTTEPCALQWRPLGSGSNTFNYLARPYPSS